MKTYLITGGAGFIGSTLADELLHLGHKVVVIDNFNDFYDIQIKENNVSGNLLNSNYKLYRADIRNISILKQIFYENKIDGVIHLAAMAGVRPSIEDPILYQDVNVVGTQTILEVMKENNIKNLVMASSSSVYGNCKTVPFKEDFIVDFAISPYAATKKSNEVMTYVYHSLESMNVIMLRFFTVYGPRQRPDLAINKFTRLIKAGNSIPVFGDGSTSRDYTYIDDIISGIIGAIEFNESHDSVYEIINLGNSSPISLNEMIEVIAKELGVTPKIDVFPMQPGDVEKTYADTSKARRLLNYIPSTTFPQGIKKFAEWIDSSESKHANNG
jgi:UDP-glucuronate 4-epimerase